MPRYQVKAIVEADKAIANGRVYTREVLESAVNDMKERLKDHTVVGQLGNLERITHVDLRNASHVLKDVAINDKGEVWAEIETLPTENGKIADKIIESSAVALDGYGETGETGDVKSFKIIAVNLIPKQ